MFPHWPPSTSKSKSIKSDKPPNTCQLCISIRPMVQIYYIFKMENHTCLLPSLMNSRMSSEEFSDCFHAIVRTTLNCVKKRESPNSQPWEYIPPSPYHPLTLMVLWRLKPWCNRLPGTSTTTWWKSPQIILTLSSLKIPQCPKPYSSQRRRDSPWSTRV